MARGQAGREVHYVGRSGDKMAIDKGTGNAGSVPATLSGNPAIDPYATVSLSDGRVLGFLQWSDVQPYFGSSDSGAWCRFTHAPKGIETHIFSWPNTLASEGRVETIKKGTRKAKPVVSTSSGVHAKHRSSGKQRAEPGVVAGRPKKARSVDSRGSSKGRTTNRGSAK